MLLVTLATHVTIRLLFRKVLLIEKNVLTQFTSRIKTKLLLQIILQKPDPRQDSHTDRLRASTEALFEESMGISECPDVSSLERRYVLDSPFVWCGVKRPSFGSLRVISVRDPLLLATDTQAAPVLFKNTSVQISQVDVDDDVLNVP